MHLRRGRRCSTPSMRQLEPRRAPSAAPSQAGPRRFPTICHELGTTMMRGLTASLSLVLAIALAALAVWTIPPGIESARLLAAQDDPHALAELALDRRFNVATAGWEIEAALAA